jgi:hypothetical protein
MGFGLVLGYISTNLNRYSTQALNNMTSYYDATSSHALAVAGANAALAKFYTDTSWSGPMDQSFSDGPMVGSFTVTMATVGGSQKRLRSVSTYTASGMGTLRDTVEVFFNTAGGTPFTEYAWYCNQDAGNIFWQNQDTVWGKGHSNGNVHIAGSPVFMDKFTTATKFDPPKPGTGTNQAIFKNGYETGVASIPYPTDLSSVVSASSGGKHYTHDISVKLLPGSALNNDGLAAVVDLSTGAKDTVHLGDAGFNGLILSDGNVSISGVLDGKVSVASLQSIKVTDDCTYERNPRLGASDDVLGLIAANNVIIADNTANHTSCAVYGSTFTLTGSLVAENLNSLPNCGNLTIYGSVIQNTEQEVGVYKAKGGGKSSLQKGFWKDFRWDPRLADANNTPPFFPGYGVKAYAISNWWESYRVSSFQ